jgi:hypothetical protein
LLLDGSSLAEVFGCHFLPTGGDDFRSQTSAYDAFLHDAWERKEATEMQVRWRLFVTSTMFCDLSHFSVCLCFCEGESLNFKGT